MVQLYFSNKFNVGLFDHIWRVRTVFHMLLLHVAGFSNLLEHVCSSDMEKQIHTQQPSEVETPFKEYKRTIMGVKYKTFVVMNRILCPLKSYWELATRTRLTTTAGGANLVITDFGVFKFHVELSDQDVQNSTSQHNDDDSGKTHFPDTVKNVRSCERETKIEERDQLHL